MAEEGRLWARIGSEAGYFSKSHSLYLQIPEIEYAGPETVASSFFLSSRSFRDGYDFADQLNLAREDLTRDRVELLAMLMFAAESEWNQRIASLEAFVDAMEERPFRQPPLEEVDAVAWALRGAESELGAPETPAAWRLGELNEYFLGQEPWRVNERHRELAALQARVMAAAEAAIEAEAMFPGARIWDLRRGEGFN